MKPKRARGVFSELVENSMHRAAWDQMLYDLTKVKPSTESQKAFRIILKDFKTLMGQYEEMVKSKEAERLFKRLSALEIQMLQIHCLVDPAATFGTLVQSKDNVKTEYIIVKAPFPLPNQKRQEIRVYVGKLSDYKGKSLKQLLMSPKFKKDAITKLTEHMLTAIRQKQEP